jgi:hypothetical protein
MSDEPKKTIDERLEALTTNVEVMSGMLHDMIARQDAADRRERKAREAIMAGIAAYIRALENGDEDEEGGR